MKEVVVLELVVVVDVEKLNATTAPGGGGSAPRVVADEVTSNLESVDYVESVTVKEVRAS